MNTKFDAGDHIEFTIKGEVEHIDITKEGGAYYYIKLCDPERQAVIYLKEEVLKDAKKL